MAQRETRYLWVSSEILDLSFDVVIAGFAFRLLRLEHPLISLVVLRNPVVVLGTISIFLVQASFIGLTVYLPVYFQSFHRLSASTTGIALLGILLGAFAGTALSARLMLRVPLTSVQQYDTTAAFICQASLVWMASTRNIAPIELFTMGIE